MIGIYEESDYENINRQRKKLLVGFWVSLAVLVAVNIAIFVLYTFQEYATPLKVPLLAINIASCALYVIIVYPIMSIKYKRVNNYYKMLYYFKNGIKSEGSNVFNGIDSSITVKDGVDFLNLKFLEWSDKKQEYFERNILFDVEKPLPDFKAGDLVHHITQGNILIAYELRSEDIFE